MMNNEVAILLKKHIRCQVKCVEHEKLYGKYLTKQAFLEVDDEMRRTMETEIAYEAPLVSGLANLVVAHGK